LKRIPKFQDEDQEREFWERADSSEYIDWSQARAVRFPALKPSTTSISVRLPDPLLMELKQLAHERDVPYQSLLKMYLADRVALERRRKRQAGGG
jgi:predicted DNA binding CopG/RHH family protein